MAAGKPAPSPAPAEVRAALARVRAGPGERGVLLYHDARLPSFTALAAGEAVHGSWWGHAKSLSGDRWQRRGLSEAARSVLKRLDRPLDAGALGLPGGRATSALITDLERRLLVYAEERHTESGRHERVLTPWLAWCSARGVPGGALPSPGEAYALLERAVSGWHGARLPWSQ